MLCSEIITSVNYGKKVCIINAKNISKTEIYSVNHPDTHVNCQERQEEKRNVPDDTHFGEV